MKLTYPAIFNPSGSDYDRQIWKGETSNIINLNDIKYTWSTPLYKQMRENFWIPEKVNLTEDVTVYKELTKEERQAYKGIVSYLNFLDSVQVTNLPYLKTPVTASEVKRIFAEQESQEQLHGESYQYMVESILPASERNFVYDFAKTDKVLLKRNKYIAAIYQKYADTREEEDYFYALIANYLLESIYFYVGFAYFFNLSHRNLMSGSADMIALIKRDELTHVRFFQRLIPEAMKLFPYSEHKIYEMFSETVAQEIEWNSYIIGDNIFGMSNDSNTQYTKYLADLRLKSIGLDPLYKVKDNPYRHLEDISDTGAEGSSKANFFESTVTSYVRAEAISGWDKV